MPVNRETVLRVLVMTHFAFVSMVLMADCLPKSYLLNQVTVLALGLLTILRRESVLHIEMFMLFKLISIFIDPIAIGMYFQIGKSTYASRHDNAYFTVSAIFAISLLILKPIMLVFVAKVRQERLNGEVFDSWATTSGYASLNGR